MKVLMLSNSDLEGGAARSAYRLHQGFQKISVNSQLHVQTKCSDYTGVTAYRSNVGIGKAITALRLTLDKLPLKLYANGRQASYSSQWLPDRMAADIHSIHPDIVNLHWINNGYIQIESLAKFKQPVVWTLHDMWAFTGGCHYNQDCDRYTDTCGKCPQLHSHRHQDLSHWIWNRKAKAWGHKELTIVTPSQWLANCAKKSSLLKDRRIEYIPYGIDTSLYRPIERRLAREILQLPQDKYLVLSGALGGTSDKRKGFHLLQPALQELSQSGWRDRLELVVFGSSVPENPPDFGLTTHYLGALHDDSSLALLYSAADVFVAPSVQDNLPNTVMEAIACGTPCVAFDIGGMPDMIEHQGNGYLAQAFKVEDLAKGIAWTLENPERHQNLSQRAREKTEQEFPLEKQAQRYTSLFQSLLEEPKTTYP